MPEHEDNREDLLAENERLRLRSQEAEEVLDAIRHGEVDALVVSGPHGDQVYTLTGADRAYRILYETMNEGAAISGPDGTLYFCNTRLSAMLDTPMELLLGGSLLGFVSATDTPAVKAFLERGLDKPQTMELALKSRDGDVVPCIISTSPFYVDGSSAMCMILTDLTERKEAEKALRQSEQRFRTIFEAAEDFIYLKDKSLRFTQVNPAFAKLVGLPASEIIGKRHEDVFEEEISDHITEVGLRVLQGDTIEEERSETIGGVSMRFLSTVVPLSEPTGEIVGTLTILHDITDRAKGKIGDLPVMEGYTAKTMKAALKSALQAAKTTSTVLLTGESGSGKDYLARFIHDHSDRANGPFWSINCAAIAPDLAESELFGHEKGSFTGAQARKRGLLELAEGGTLLLNEIGEMSLSLQSKLLTFLDTRAFRRVGGEKEVTVNARLIAATNMDLDQAVKDGRFRQDLLYRIEVMRIDMPPLRERLEDSPLLVQEILSQLQKELQIPSIPGIRPEIMEKLKRYHWPGNVRELRNVLERALMVSGDEGIDPACIAALPCQGRNGEWSFTTSFLEGATLHHMTEDLIKSACLEALRRCGNRKQEAARMLGISRDSLYRYLGKFAIKLED